MKNTLYRYAAVGVAMMFLAACSDTISDVQFENWEPEIAAPVLDTRFTLRDALADSDFSDYLTEDTNSAINIRITQALFDVVPGELLNVPSIVVPLLDTATSYNLEDEGIDLAVSRMDLTGGQVKYIFRNDYPEDAVVTITTANWILDGQPLQHTYTVPGLTTTADSVQLSTVSLVVPPSGDIDVNYKATLTTGVDVRLTLGTVNFKGTDFSYAEGSLDAIELDLGTDSIATDYFDAFEVGTVGLVDPVARLVIQNEIGAPFELMTNVAFATTRDGENIKLETPLTQGFTFEYPSLAEGRLSKTSELIIDRETSNLVDVLNSFPESISLGLQGTANPDSLEETFFIHRDARLKGVFEVDIPLALEFNGFQLEQEFAFDGSSIAEALEAAFLLRVDNGFGLEAATQVYFYDGNGALLDSLLAAPEIIVAAPEVDQQGAAVASIEKTTEVVIPPSKIANLAKSRFAKVEVTLKSPSTGAQYTQLFYDSSIGIKLGARITVKPL
ncbi:MAG: hypothetical protein AB8F78_19195 [Saprospiraceae bacterium]